MSQYHPLLVPQNPALCRGRRNALVSFWRKKGLLGASDPDIRHGYHGSSSGRAYPDMHFDYVHIYDGAPRFVTASSTEGWGATCTQCAADLDETLFDLRDDWPDDAVDETTDMSTVTISCPTCHHANPLATLQAERDTTMTPFYIHVAYADPARLQGAFMTELEAFMGTEFRVVLLRL